MKNLYLLMMAIWGVQAWAQDDVMADLLQAQSQI